LGLNSESLRDALGSRQFEMSVLDDERAAEASRHFLNQKAALTGVQRRQFKEVN
jgi:hypothetical protein